MLPRAGSGVLVAAALQVCVWAAFAQELPETQPISPLPEVHRLQLDARKIRLGQRLFFDARMSHDNSRTCATCHRSDHGGADVSRFSAGVGGQHGVVNTPSVFNSSLNFRQFWDGRAATLEEQIDMVVRNPRELASSWDEVLDKLGADQALRQEFRQAYPGGLNQRSVSDALATYERSLLTPSRFDRYLRGDATAINAQERKGYALFKSYGCVACHQGVNVGGNLFQKFGVYHDISTHIAGTEADRGRFNVTGRDSDMHVFKVPSLRNVALTAPYFHDGSAATLPQAISIMMYYQLGRIGSKQDIADIAAFLTTLNGEHLPERP